MSGFSSAARSRLPRLAGEATSRARLALVPARSTGARRAPFVALVLCLLAAGMVGLLVFNTAMQQDAFHATALQHRADRLLARQQALRMAVGNQRDPQRLALRARALGMVDPPNPAFLRLPGGQVLGKPVVATVDDGVHVRTFPAIKPGDLAPAPRVVHVTAPARPAAGEKAEKQKTEKQKTDKKKRAGADKTGRKKADDHGGRR